MLRKIHTQAINAKLNRIANGERSGLDFMEILKGEWFASEKNNELYRYKNGVFEAYPSDGEGKKEFKKYHVIKVISDDAVEVRVEETEQVYRVVGVGENLQWETIDTRE